jgi:hypothetical protein
MSTSKVQQWKNRKEHEVLLPSGMEVKIVVPNLPSLIRAGKIPNSLLNAAVEQATAAQDQKVPDSELIGQQEEFYRKIIPLTVIEPKIEEDDVSDLPFEDQELLVELATRQRDVDAAYRHIGGLDSHESFRTFRSGGGVSEAVESS